MWAIVPLFMWKATRTQLSMPLDNPATLLLIALLVYSTLPPLFWIAQGGQYLSISSGRLYFLQPSYDEQYSLLLVAFIFMIAFLAAQWPYLHTYKYTAKITQPPLSKAILISSLILVIFNAAFVFGLQVTGYIRSASSYGDSYLAMQELPLLLRQVVKILGGVAFFAKIVSLVWLFQNWSTQKIWILIFLVITSITFDAEGGRTTIFLNFLACIILWNKYVMQVSFKTFGLLALFGLSSFTFLGIYRESNLNVSDFNDISIFDFGLGEFDGLWGNAVELRREFLVGLSPPFQLYFSEFYSIIPQFFLPFEKLQYSIWYLETYYPEYKDSGGGNMFGLLAQLVVGYGIVEAIVRGFLLGWVLGWVNKYLRNNKKWWAYPTLVYLSVWIYYSIRDSSFSLMNNVFQFILVGILLINIASNIFKSSDDIVRHRS